MNISRLVVLFVFILSFKASAYSYIEYDANKVKLNRQSFYRYIRPQIRTLISEYYDLSLKQNEYFRSISQIRRALFNLYIEGAEPLESCHDKLNEDKAETCEKNLARYISQFHKIDLELLRLLEMLSTSDYMTKVDGLNLISLLTDLSTVIYEQINILENLMLTKDYPFSNTKSITVMLPKVLSEANIRVELAMTSLFDTNVKPYFTDLFLNFIKQLELHIIHEGNADYLVRRLEQLNITWNAFHMSLVKGHIPVSQQKSQTIYTMHRRWNSVLKIILGSIK